VTRIIRKENKCYAPWILALHAYLSFSNVLPESIHYNLELPKKWIPGDELASCGGVAAAGVH
jgi:hypothetical protein